MEGKEEQRRVVELPITAAQFRTWVVAVLAVDADDRRFAERQRHFAELVALAREVQLAERLALLLAAESPVHEGRSLERIAEPISGKRLKRAAASRLETVRRRWPRAADMIAFLRDREVRLWTAEPSAVDGDRVAHRRSVTDPEV